MEGAIPADVEISSADVEVSADVEMSVVWRVLLLQLPGRDQPRLLGQAGL